MARTTGWTAPAPVSVTKTSRDTLQFVFSIDADFWPGSHIGFERLLQLCERRGLRPTIFAAGRFAEQYPDLLRECARRGYELGTHGWEHAVDQQERFGGASYVTQRRLLTLSTDALLQATGIRARAFRAPNLHVDETTLRVLSELEYRVDSSVPSHRFDLGYGRIDSPRYYRAPLHPYHPDPSDLSREGTSKVLEVPPSAFFVPLNMSALRAFGLRPLQWAVRRVMTRSHALTFYCHPLEFELAERQAAVANTPARYRRGLGPQNIALLEKLIDYVLSCGFTSAFLSEVESLGREERQPQTAQARVPAP
ncbi:MAG: polysaccharide deacetylase family protein [Gemmatimonadaceae bacterium]